MILGDVSASAAKTPMVELACIGQGLPGRIVGKLEMRNPRGRVKDRENGSLRFRGIAPYHANPIEGAAYMALSPQTGDDS